MYQNPSTVPLIHVAFSAFMDGTILVITGNQACFPESCKARPLLVKPSTICVNGLGPGVQGGNGSSPMGSIQQSGRKRSESLQPTTAT